jgi:hypothetical protein
MASAGDKSRTSSPATYASWALRPLTMAALWIALAVLADAHANTTYRAGHHVLVVGDDAARVTALLGKPQSISRAMHMGGRLPGQNAKRRHRGARDRKGPRRYQAVRWHYRLDNQHVVVTLVSGKVVDIASGR